VVRPGWLKTAPCQLFARRLVFYGAGTYASAPSFPADECETGRGRPLAPLAIGGSAFRLHRDMHLVMAARQGSTRPAAELLVGVGILSCEQWCWVVGVSWFDMDSGRRVYIHGEWIRRRVVAVAPAAKAPPACW
jgi:hypothetical protein